MVKAEKKDKPSKSLITDVHLFPRCEYYARFEGTTAFAMNEEDYWGTYHRSESSRFFSEMGGRKGSQFLSPCVDKPQNANSFHAHIGGYFTPFSTDQYANAVNVREQIVVSEGTANVRDHLLLYKNKMARIVVNSFESFNKKNQQRFKIKYKKDKFYLRPIVYTDSDYPCVLVQLPALNPSQTKNPAAEYWEKHPKPFQSLLLSSFIAFLNVEAMRANIPIEMVLRAGFGHNLPSVCETNNTFRINVGLIPECYAKLIGKSLFQLNKVIGQISDAKSKPAPFDNAFLARVRSYNAKKLKKAIHKKEIYKELRSSRDFQKAENSDESFDRLYQAFLKVNKTRKSEGQARFTPVRLKNKTIWEAIRQAGDSMGKSILSECFRKKWTEDWFANQVMDALLAQSENPIEDALCQLLKCLSYGEKVTLNYRRMRQELKIGKPKFQFESRSFKNFYSQDHEFSKVVQMLCDAFLVKKPLKELYAVLESAGTNLFLKYKSIKKTPDIFDYGSDSEFSDELSDEDIESREKHHMSHFKFRVCSGMKAIVLAAYGAKSYLCSHGVKRSKEDIEQMYYESESALKMIKISQEVTKNVMGEIASGILYFDLNHCNTTNKQNNPSLSEKLNGSDNIAVIVLDHTSSTMGNTQQALRQCFSQKNVRLVMLVDSGLKNNQGGIDLNPYGELRICGRDRKTTAQVAEMMKKALSEADKISPKTNEGVRVFKKKGLSFSLYNLYKTNKKTSQPIEEDDLSSDQVPSESKNGIKNH